jgi:hypothetical protein
MYGTAESRFHTHTATHTAALPHTHCCTTAHFQTNFPTLACHALRALRAHYRAHCHTLPHTAATLLHTLLTQPRALQQTAAHCRTLPHSYTLPRALPYTTKQTAVHCCTARCAHTTMHTATHYRSHYRTMPHCRTLPHCRTAAHCRIQCLWYTTKRTASRNVRTLPCALPQTVARTAVQVHSHTAALPDSRTILMKLYKFTYVRAYIHTNHTNSYILLQCVAFKLQITPGQKICGSVNITLFYFLYFFTYKST